MKSIPSKYTCCITFAFALIIVGIFGLLWLRQQVYWQASYGKRLEKTLFLLQQKNQQADFRLAQIQSTQHLRHCCQDLQLPSRAQIIWTYPQNKHHTFAQLAFNH